MKDRLTVDDVLNRINELLDEKGLTLYKLSEVCNVPHSSLYTMMQRRTMPKYDTLDSICEGLGISLSDFFIKKSRVTNNCYLSEKEIMLIETLRLLPDSLVDLVIAYAKGICDTYEEVGAVKKQSHHPK